MNGEQTLDISKECTMEFIDKKFIEVTCQNIMKSTSIGLLDSIMLRVESLINEKLKVALPKNMDENLINSLETEIQFLREEVRTKNTMISVLVEESIKRNEAKNLSYDKIDCPKKSKTVELINSDDDFIKPKKFIKNNGYHDYNDVNKIDFTQNNPFDNLKHDEDIKFRKFDHSNVTKRKIPSQKKSSQKKNKNDTKENSNTSKSKNNNSTSKIKDNNNTKQVVSILGDSIIKEVKGYELSTQKHRVIVKSFSGATTACMKDYVKPSLKYKPSLVVLHCGTNDLKICNDSEQIATNVVNLAMQISSQETKVSVSSLTSRDDKFQQRVSEVNCFLEKMCLERNLAFLNNVNISACSHLNRSRLHLNRKGTKLLTSNFKFHLQKF